MSNTTPDVIYLIDGECDGHECKEWCEFAGIYELMFGCSKSTKERGRPYSELSREDCLIMNHSGCVPLTNRHRVDINKAYENYITKYPNAKATYGNVKDICEVDEDNPMENSALCRLEWLKFWVNWALDNCDKPVFANR